MLTKFFTFACVFALLFTQPSLLLAQNSGGQADWSSVKAVAVKTKLRIQTKDGKTIEGNLTDASDQTLTINRKGKTLTFNQTDIKRIYTFKGGSRAVTALIGAGIGAGGGAGAAAALLGATGGSDGAIGIIANGILLGAGIGAAIGAIEGKGQKRVLIYESN